jgi:hypothetical protein
MVFLDNTEKSLSGNPGEMMTKISSGTERLPHGYLGRGTAEFEYA